MSNFFEAGKAAMTSNRQDWETPEALFRELDDKYHFTIDVAATHDNAKCERYYTIEDDGLSKSWSGETVWCNPPYDRASRRWIAKMAEEAAGGGGVRIVALLPARTDVKAFHDYLYKKENVRIEFLRGRLKYELGGVPLNSAPFPSMLVFFNC